MHRNTFRPAKPSSDPSHYCQLFEPTPIAISKDDPRLECLAWSMCDQHPPGDDPHISPGYTYFGQFIDHDLTCENRKTTPITNLRKHFLNLDCLYGEDPASDTDLYESDGSFRLGTAAGGDVNLQDAKVDVPLSKINGKPVAADLRNLENAIVRQIHVLFLKLHNTAIRALPNSWSFERRLRNARKRVCHQYQYLVRTDFLPRICHPDIYGSILHEPMIDWDDQFCIPLEFSQAAFRFGHSMVRSRYVLRRRGPSVPLETLFSKKEREEPLPSEHVIEWSPFLEPGFDRAMKINTGIESPLFHVPPDAGRLFRVRTDQPIPLPHLTLQRGATSRLASGQFICRTLKASPISAASVGPWKHLIECNLDKETPLWYYILLEAELNEYGGLLGGVGGRIVGEVIEGALFANEKSYLRTFGPCWKPDPWPVGNGKMQMETLRDLAIIVASQPG